MEVRCSRQRIVLYTVKMGNTSLFFLVEMLNAKVHLRLICDLAFFWSILNGYSLT